MEAYFENFISLVEDNGYMYKLSDDSEHVANMYLNYESEEGKEQIVHIISLEQVVLISAVVEYESIDSSKDLGYLNDLNSYYKDYRFTFDDENNLCVAGMFNVNLDAWEFINSATVFTRVKHLCDCCFDIRGY